MLCHLHISNCYCLCGFTIEILKFLEHCDNATSCSEAGSYFHMLFSFPFSSHHSIERGWETGSITPQSPAITRYVVTLIQDGKHNNLLTSAQKAVVKIIENLVGKLTTVVLCDLCASAVKTEKWKSHATSDSCKIYVLSESRGIPKLLLYVQSPHFYWILYTLEWILFHLCNAN